ncbi:MAG: helix-turn-helix transcriptional regulator [Clostridia bacterium]|nr:helix-turn-helix transcriptional regulator [Clostridia bacterium]
MLIFDSHIIGNNLFKVIEIKRSAQTEVTEKVELSDRTYANIERSSTTMQINSLLKICTALHITPNDILLTDNTLEITEQDITETIIKCSKNKHTIKTFKCLH